MLGVKYHSVLMRSGRVLNEAGRRVDQGPGSCFTYVSHLFHGSYLIYVFGGKDYLKLFVIFYPLLHPSES